LIAQAGDIAGKRNVVADTSRTGESLAFGGLFGAGEVFYFKIVLQGIG